MNDYIKREDATEAVWRILNDMGISQKHNDRLVEEVDAVLDEYPAADVRPVVLCGECKRYGGRPWEKNETGICARTDSGVREDDFCSYGERREES